MDPISSGSASNPINNPRLDLLHNTGTNEQLKGVAGSYGPTPSPTEAPKPPAAPAVVAMPAAPAPGGAAYPAPAPTGGAPKTAASYVAAAESKRPKTSSPIQAQPIPEPRMAPQPQGPAASVVSSDRSGVKVALIVTTVLVVLGAAGFAGYWFWQKSQNQTAAPTTQAPTTSNTDTGNTANSATTSNSSVTAVAPTSLGQASDSGKLTDGASTTSDKVTFTFTMPTTATSGSVVPQIEVRPEGTAFTGEPTSSGNTLDATGSDLAATVPVSSLAVGSYHWQARFVANGTSGPWTTFGSGSGASFTVTAAAPSSNTTASGATTPTTTSAAPPSATAAPAAPSTQLAPTGDATTITSFICLMVMILAGAGWLAVRRYGCA